MSTMCLRIRKGINVSKGAGGYEMQNAQTVVRMGDGGRVVNPVIWPKDRRTCYTSSGTGTVTPYMIKCSQSFHDRNNIAIRALFNGLALEYLYKHLVSPCFEAQFNVSGHHGISLDLTIKDIRRMEESVRKGADESAYEDDGLIFPVRYCFNVTFPVKGNEGIILRLRVGGMVKQRGFSNPHKY